MKGISTVIATILLLMITIALITMAAGYIFGWWGRIRQGIELYGTPQCIENAPDKAVIKIRNFGTQNLTVNVEQTAPAGDSADNPVFSIQPGQIYTYKDNCTGTGSRFCVYTFTPSIGWPLSDISVPCT